MKPLNDDRAGVLVADAKRALDGLSASLSKGLYGMTQGALHCHDLVVAMTQVGLDPIASIVNDISYQLTLGQPGVLDLAKSVVPLIEKSLSDLSMGLMPESQQLQEQWLPVAQRLQETLVQGPVPSEFFDTAALRLPSTATPLSITKVHGRIHGATAQNELLLESLPDVSTLRVQGLRLVQRARVANHKKGDRSVIQVDNLLSELQDWSLRLGQRALSSIYPRFQTAIKDVFVDPDQLLRLASVSSFVERATHVSAQVRGLTLFLDWCGLTLSGDEQHQIAEVISEMRGQMRSIGYGYRLTFPCSLARVRVVPFVLKGQRYAVTAAQYLKFESTSGKNDGFGKIFLRSGITTKSLDVDQVLAPENVNVSSIPREIAQHQWMVGVILDKTGVLYPWVAPL